MSDNAQIVVDIEVSAGQASAAHQSGEGRQVLALGDDLAGKPYGYILTTAGSGDIVFDVGEIVAGAVEEPKARHL